MKLKPCPLCAASAKTVKFAKVFWMVKCTECMLTYKDMHTSEEAAITGWNTRMTPQDRRNESKKRWSKKSFFEIVNNRTGEVLVRFLEYPEKDDANATKTITVLMEYGFNWDHHDYAKRTGVDTSYSGHHRIPTELRYYDEVY